MYDDVDLTNPHDIERMRRSIAMGPGSALVLTGDQADRVLRALINALRAGSEDGTSGGADLSRF